MLKSFEIEIEDVTFCGHVEYEAYHNGFETGDPRYSDKIKVDWTTIDYTNWDEFTIDKIQELHKKGAFQQLQDKILEEINEDGHFELNRRL